MSRVSANEGVPPDLDLAEAEPENWVEALSTPGPRQDRAMGSLHQMLLRASRHQVWRMRSTLAGIGDERLEEIANQAADEAMMAVLAKLSTFEGRSRFTTWAYKFAILQSATEVRRFAWQQRGRARRRRTAPDARPFPSQLRRSVGPGLGGPQRDR